MRRLGERTPSTSFNINWYRPYHQGLIDAMTDFTGSGEVFNLQWPSEGVFQGHSQLSGIAATYNGGSHLHPSRTDCLAQETEFNSTSVEPTSFSNSRELVILEEKDWDPQQVCDGYQFHCTKVVACTSTGVTCKGIEARYYTRRNTKYTAYRPMWCL
ncbi:hypothetical protein, variant [Cladophialophora immunda]|uniref:Uncharacterized protein n=1 Tax=Cladophialophora immunda TaxID=569365 RepID=A0A0D2CEH9_9EURO|nr:uncharacterized protein PV07_12648 [Cladophialophora immunda]XP_016242160.1 hypothetical protein, variant [Cladophialophora immunda]KIW21943.1 hypothetical protein PV07_12648 [Cladophialophora immunda]KIW21944.1 hypothetical protein, variant [Cladophialophora immunda]